jgi:hypothetical protein
MIARPTDHKQTLFSTIRGTVLLGAIVRTYDYY